jgi:large subunit ribosomal protein L24
VQTTLLGVAIAFILALVTALAGPYFVDWSHYRAEFETRASRFAGTLVRVSGAIDIRILPTPTLVLHRVEIGPRGEQPKLKAESLNVELALGALLRGEIHAAELRLAGPEFRIALNHDGKIEAPALAGLTSPDFISIERFSVVDGRAVFADAASGSQVVLSALAFDGEVRSLAGPLRGEGGFIAAGQRYGYRISAGRMGEDGGAKLRVSFEPSHQPLSIEADGVLSIERGAPRFEGALAMRRLPGPSLGNGKSAALPWMAAGRVNATPSGASFEQLEFQYGPEDRTTKFTGAAELTLGNRPLFKSSLHARQADIARTFDLPEETQRQPIAAIKMIFETFGETIAPPIPMQLSASIDSIALGGAVIQSVNADVEIGPDGWNFEKFEFRAPGFSQIRLTGRLRNLSKGMAFAGSAMIESAQPLAFADWLHGQDHSSQGTAGALRLRGNVTIDRNLIAVDRLRLEHDRTRLEGRLTYAFASGAHPSRLDADLAADNIDIDDTIRLARPMLADPVFVWPGETSLALTIGRGMIAGVEARNVSVRGKYGKDGLAIERLAVADIGGAKLDVSGRLALPLSSRGEMRLALDAKSLDGLAAVVSKFAPRMADRAQWIAAHYAPANIGASLEIAHDAKSPSGKGSRVALRLDGTAAAASIKASAALSGELASLDTAINLKTSFESEGTKIGADGTLRWLKEVPSGTFDLSLATADASVLRRVGAAPIPLELRSRAALSGNKIVLENLSGKVAGSSIDGRIAVILDRPLQVEGRIRTNEFDAASLMALAVGAPMQGIIPPGGARWASEPFSTGVFSDVEGRIDVEAARAWLTPALAASGFQGSVSFDQKRLAFEHVKAKLAGGSLSAHSVFENSPEGLSANASFDLKGADIALLLPEEGSPPLRGRLSLKIETRGMGRSPAALVGSLSGTGALSLENAQIASLSPRAFGAAVEAADRGLAINSVNVGNIVATALAAGRLDVPKLEGALVLGSGQLRGDHLTALTPNADMESGGGFDLTDGSFDLKVRLRGPEISDAPGKSRPEIGISLKGPLDAPKKTVDVAALVELLALRAVDREARRLEAIELPVGSVPVGPTAIERAPDLPAPIDIKSMRGVARPATSPNVTGITNAGPAQPQQRIHTPPLPLAKPPTETIRPLRDSSIGAPN